MLKKPAFVALVLAFSATLNAQFKKGDRMVGVSVGSVFFNSNSTDFSSSAGSSSTSNTNYGVSLIPSMGWFTTSNIAIGVSPSFNYTKQKQLGKSAAGNTYLKDETSQFSFGIGGFTRYYFAGTSNKTRFFGQYNLSLGLSGSKSEGFEYETLGVYVDRYNRKSSGDLFVNTGLTFGVSKFLANHNSLDFYIGYTFSYTSSNPKGTTLRDYSDPATGDINQTVDYKQKITGHNVVLGVGYQVFLEKK
ncbi:MAG: hypothetical protein Q8941_15620 [Bacteroidota bacterium]|nr:hypothetical protein [Bacteroidota bacterium]